MAAREVISTGGHEKTWHLRRARPGHTDASHYLASPLGTSFQPLYHHLERTTPLDKHAEPKTPKLLAGAIRAIPEAIVVTRHRSAGASPARVRQLAGVWALKGPAPSRKFLETETVPPEPAPPKRARD